MYKKKVIISADGSSTIELIGKNEQYHSIHGALQESEHVFIRYGLQQIAQQKKQISILEIGMGTALNVLLSYCYAQKHHLNISYTAIEKYPLSEEILYALNYPKLITDCPQSESIFKLIHNSEWDEQVDVSKTFSLKKIKGDAQNINLKNNHFDLIFHDAFNPDLEPDLWSKELFEKFYFSMKPNGILTTYSTKGIVKRALKSAGFAIEKKPGPIGKREILNAIKKI